MTTQTDISPTDSPETQESQPRAGIYCRMSLAVMDDKTKVDDQERICRELAARLGWDAVEVYQDNNRSAWQPNRKRPGWDRMLADIKAGRITGIVVYHGDRLLRTHEDLLALINLARTRGIRLASPAGTRDLDNADDQFILEIEASMAKRESANTSRRRKAQYERWRRDGRVRPGGRGGRPFGYETDGLTMIPKEALILDEAASRVLTGEAIGSICADLNARDIHTTTGGPFSHSTLRKMLARPRYAGLMPDGVHEAAWRPILDRETWEAVCAVLNSKAAGFSYTTNARRYLLSGIAKCGPCGAGLQIRGEGYRAHGDGKQCVRRACALEHHWEPMPRRTGYGCVRPGCRKVQRQVALLDEFVSAAVVAKLNDPANPPGRVPRNTAMAAEMRALMAQRAETEAAITDPSVGTALPLLLRRLSSVDARLAQLREMAAGSARVRLLACHAGITRAAFAALPLAARRSLVAALFTVTVLPAGKRGPGFRPADVRLAPAR